MDRQLIAGFTRHILTARTAYVRGKVGEQMIFHMLKLQGYQVYEPDGKCQGDIKVIDQTTGEALKVEVKTASVDKRGHYQFCLRKKDKYGGTDCAPADFVILVAVTKSGSHSIFVIPAGELTTKATKITGNPHEYAGKWAKFRQYHNTVNLRTDVQNFSDRVAMSGNTVYSGSAALQ